MNYSECQQEMVVKKGAEEGSAMLLQGIAKHRAGVFGEAEALYRKVISDDPENAEACRLLGLICQQTGRGGEAAVLLQRAVELRPASLEAHSALAIVLNDLGEMDAALASFQRLVNLAPNDPNARCNLGVMLQKMGRYQEALDCLQQAISLRPDFAEAYNNCGVALRALERSDEAIECYRKALAINPNYAQAYNNLGNVYRDTGRTDEALHCFQKALAINPTYVESYNNMGNAYRDCHRHGEALRCYQKALALQPEYAEAYVNLGWEYLSFGDAPKAVASIKKALELRPDYAEAHSDLGAVLRQLGRHEEAIQSCRRALELMPNFGEAYRTLCNLKKHREEDDEVRSMVALYESTAIPAGQRIHLCFGLGKVYDDLGEHRKAFDFYHEGNRLKRATYTYDLEDERRSFARLRKVFSKEFFEDGEDSGFQDRTPIFIVGMPRSGTTLVEQILASHPDVFGAGELYDLQLVAKALGRGGFPESLYGLESEELSKAGEVYLARIRRYSAQAKRITDKMPQNFQYLGLIRRILPHAKVIHIMRNPLDTCLSIYKNFFTGHHGYAYDLEELGGYHLLYQELMEHWRSVLPRGWMYEVRYEDIVTNQEEETRRLLEYCGLEWDDACLAFHRKERRVATASAAQVRQPIYKSSVGLWEKYREGLEPLRQALDGGSRGEGGEAKQSEIGPAVTFADVLSMSAAGRTQEAEVACRQVIAADPANSEAHHFLGVLCLQSGREALAAKYIVRAVQLFPEYAEAYCNLGVALRRLGRTEEAIAAYRQALRIKPDYANACNNLGSALNELGRRDEARESYRNAIAIDSEFAVAHRHLACLEKHEDEDDEVRAMVALYGSGTISDDQRMHLAFALGKVYAEIGEHPKAFAFLQEANRLKRATYRYDAADDQRFFERIKQTFSRDFFAERQGAGYPDETPIFIVGMPRSGTSLVEQILASHPDVFGAGELHDLQQVAACLGKEEFPESAASVAAETLIAAGRNYLARIRRLAPEVLRITDKLPQNFLFLGLARAILPNAKVIHCVRNPEDTCFSIYKNFFTNYHGYAYDLEELGAYYRLYEDLMAHWREVFPAGWIHEVRYEDVVANQEEESRKLLAFCGLGWNDACLGFHQTKRRVTTTSATQVRQPIYTDSVGLWEKYGEELAPLRRALKR